MESRAEFFSTSEAGKICGVARTTIIRWIDEGSLKAFTTPGGHRKIKREDLTGFLLNRKIEVPYDVDKNHAKKILVVDDSEEDLKLFEAVFLAAQGRYKVFTASDSFEAIYKIGELKPDIVVLDLMMPNIDGFKLCSSIKSSKLTDDIKVIVTTAHGDDENRTRCLRCGADAFFTKPLDWQGLITRILEFSALPFITMFLQ